MWTARHKIVERGFKAKEGRNVIILDFVYEGFHSRGLQVKSKWRRKD